VRIIRLEFRLNCWTEFIRPGACTFTSAHVLRRNSGLNLFIQGRVRLRQPTFIPTPSRAFKPTGKIEFWGKIWIEFIHPGARTLTASARVWFCRRGRQTKIL